MVLVAVVVAVAIAVTSTATAVLSRVARLRADMSAPREVLVEGRLQTKWPARTPTFDRRRPVMRLALPESYTYPLSRVH